MTTHEIISATEAPGGVQLQIRHRDGLETYEHVSTQTATVLGWKRPDPQPVDPAWMVEVVREAVARSYDAADMALVARAYRAGERDDSNESKVAADALRLALSRGHVVLPPVMPSEEEMLRDAREDAAQSNERGGCHDYARRQRSGLSDHGGEVQAALQARRNVYASLGAVAGKAVSSGPVVPEVDLRKVANQAWMEGWVAAEHALMGVRTADFEKTFAEAREADISAILENLKSGEA